MVSVRRSIKFSMPASLTSVPEEERNIMYVNEDATMSADDVQVPAVTKCHAVITISEPYKFKSVSDELAALFDLAPEQMRRRSIKMLQGPRTNAARLGAAIKSARLNHTSELPLTAYSRYGSELSLVISCSPHCVAGGDVDGIILKFYPVWDCSNFAENIANNVDATNNALAAACPALRTSPVEFSPYTALRRQSEQARALYNRSVGRELAARRQGMAIERAASAEGSDDLLLSLLLRSVEVE